MTIRQHLSVFLAAIAAVALSAAPSSALAQDASKTASKDAPPQMTPEQQAEMDAYMKAGTPGEPHKRLAAMVGKYSVKMKNWHEPGGPAMEETGTATRSMALDGRVLVEQFSGKMMGSPFHGHGMTGYDNVLGQYWSTWNDSMSTGIMISSGSCDAKNACTFTGSWNDAIKKAPVKTRMTTRWPDADTEIFEMYGPDKQGREMKMMELTYKRM